MRTRKMAAVILMPTALLAFCLADTAKATTYDIYVDIDNAGAEDGTIGSPYNTIGEAITAAELNDDSNRKIYVYAGDYAESIDLTDDVKIYGEDKDTTIISGDGSTDTVTMDNNTSIKNLTVSGGTNGITVSKNSAATIEDCEITDTGKIGINIEGGNKKNRTVAILDNEIYDNSGKGIYIQAQRKLDIRNNEIYDNDEEGIDVRKGAKGKISSNKIHNNGESGVELVVGSSHLKIRKNTLKSNESSGITNQFYKDAKKTGQITIEDNKITKNKSFGVKCATPSGDGNKKTEDYWKKSLIFLENIFKQNKKDEIQKACVK